MAGIPQSSNKENEVQSTTDTTITTENSSLLEDVLGRRNYTRVYSPHYAATQNKAKQYSRLQNQATKRKYLGSVLGEKMYGALTALHPQSSLSSLAETITLSSCQMMSRNDDSGMDEGVINT